MYDNEVLKVCRLENGFEVEIYQKPPPPPKKNKGTSKDAPCGCGPYVDPWKSYAFTTDKEVLAFIKEKLPGLTRGDEYEEGFAEATAND